MINNINMNNNNNQNNDNQQWQKTTSDKSQLLLSQYLLNFKVRFMAPTKNIDSSNNNNNKNNNISASYYWLDLDQLLKLGFCDQQ